MTCQKLFVSLLAFFGILLGFLSTVNAADSWHQYQMVFEGAEVVSVNETHGCYRYTLDQASDRLLQVTASFNVGYLLSEDSSENLSLSGYEQFEAEANRQHNLMGLCDAAGSSEINVTLLADDAQICTFTFILWPQSLSAISGYVCADKVKWTTIDRYTNSLSILPGSS